METSLVLPNILSSNHIQYNKKHINIHKYKNYILNFPVNYLVNAGNTYMFYYI